MKQQELKFYLDHCSALVKIFTAFLALGYIPEAWQRVSVIFIPKPGRTLYELAKSFRPIKVTSFLLITMERFVDQSTRMGPLIRFPSERLQHAYQRGRSSETALHDLVSRIKSALSHQIFALGTFRNVEGALITLPLKATIAFWQCRRAIEKTRGLKPKVVYWIYT
jgi:hypothetical protein